MCLPALFCFSAVADANMHAHAQSPMSSQARYSAFVLHWQDPAEGKQRCGVEQPNHPVQVHCCTGVVSGLCWNLLESYSRDILFMNALILSCIDSFVNLSFPVVAINPKSDALF
jgi:hypothetical protein